MDLPERAHRQMGPFWTARSHADLRHVGVSDDLVVGRQAGGANRVAIVIARGAGGAQPPLSSRRYHGSRRRAPS
jgi:hypothetical protein